MLVSKKISTKKMTDGISDGYRMTQKSEERTDSLSRILKLLFLRKNETLKNPRVEEIFTKFPFWKLKDITVFSEKESVFVERLLKQAEEIDIEAWVKLIYELRSTELIFLDYVLGFIYEIWPFNDFLKNPVIIGVGNGTWEKQFDTEVNLAYTLGSPELIKVLKPVCDCTVNKLDTKSQPFIVILSEKTLSFYFA